MASRIGISVALCLLAVTSGSAQVVRFETTVGDFDMVLNPTNNSRLEGHVDNMLAYVENGNYNGSWINRAPEGFVLQMGSFFAHTKRPVQSLASTRPVFSFDPVVGQPAAELSLSNTVGTVSLAIPGGNQDGGSSSFFINLGDNSSLNTDFTVFAAISDMTVINQIMALMQVDIRDEVGAGDSNVHFQDIPLAADGKQVFIERAFVVTDSLSIARASAAVAPTMVASAEAFADESSSASLISTAVPEPASLLQAAIGMFSMGIFSSHRRRK